MWGGAGRHRAAPHRRVSKGSTALWRKEKREQGEGVGWGRTVEVKVARYTWQQWVAAAADDENGGHDDEDGLDNDDRD